MLVKHNTIVIDINKDVNENIENFNKRSIFIVKNLNSGYSIEDIIDLSFIYNNKQTLQVVYDEKIEQVIEKLQQNMYIKL
jgi:hypothetical protein